LDNRNGLPEPQAFGRERHASCGVVVCKTFDVSQRHKEPALNDWAAHQSGTGASERVTAGRALVPMTASATAETTGTSPRALLAFVAHLIATAQHAPQTRARCRAEPAGASEQYAHAAQYGNSLRKYRGWTI
jgi:hypothetical protein